LGKGDYFVAEGDESDGSFLRTNPFIGVITGMDLDHIDYWKSEKALEEAYDAFIAKTEHLIYCIDDPKLQKRSLKGLSYGTSSSADIQLFSDTSFSFCFQGKVYEKVPLTIFGIHNKLNSLALFGICQLLGLSDANFFEALSTFQGVDRRMEMKGVVKGVTYLDDYAHHPKEVEATLQAVRSKVEKGKLVLVFQPHRFSRFHTFSREFATALEGDESLIITDIYGAGEENIYQVHANDLTALLSRKNVLYAKRSELSRTLSKIVKEGDTVLAMGAGDITSLKKEME
jgi:UDP-N-acetylmuramate--alanine ligase